MAKSLLPLLFLLLVCLSQLADCIKQCGTPDLRPVPADGKDHFKKSAEMEKAQQIFGFHPIAIPMVFHYVAISGDTTTAATAPSQARLEKTVYGTNLAYLAANSGFRFTLNSTLLFHSEPTLSDCEGSNDNIREYLAGKYNVNHTTMLNVYICTKVDDSGSTLGVASFPYLFKGSKNNTFVFIKDTEIALLSFAFGGPTDPLYNATLTASNSGYDPCLTLIHEIGHWLGLFHPHQGACECCFSGDDYCELGASSFCQSASDPSSGTCGKVCGDSVADTPAVENPQSALDEADYFSCSDTDTCKELPGDDDGQNYMSYNWDNCKYYDGALRGHLTFGQVVRMRSQMMIYRKEFFPDIFPVGGRKTWTKSHSRAPLTAAQSKSNSPYPSFKKTQNVRRRK